MAKTVTVFGNAQISTVQSKFGGSAGLFDGTGDWLTTPSHADFNNVGNFAIDYWFRVPSGAQKPLVNIGSGAFGGNTSLTLYTTAAGAVVFYVVNSTGTINWNLSTGAGTIAIDTWYHYEVDVSSDTAYVFLDGVQKTSAAASGSRTEANNTELFICGSTDSASVNSFNGYVDEFRWSKIARHTSGFTPPSSAYTVDADTGLLLHMLGANGSTTFTDGGVDASMASNKPRFFFLTR